MVENPTSTEFEERRKKTFWERLDDVGEVCNDRHRRQTTRIGQLEAQNDAQAADIAALKVRVSAIEQGPVEATKIRFSSGVLVSVVLVTASVVGAGYGFSAVVTSKIDTLSKRLDDQAASAAKLTEERSAAAQRSIDALTRQMELLKYEQQRLREDVTGKQRSTK